MNHYLDCWIRVAADFFRQALAGEPNLVESKPEPLEGDSVGFAVTLAGDVSGRFIVRLDASILEAPLLGEGVEQKQGWTELLRETFEAACGELLARTGKKSRVERVEEDAPTENFTRSFQLQTAERRWGLWVLDETRAVESDAPEEPQTAAPGPRSEAVPSSLSPGLELLLDVELEASLRFGCREMPLGEILDLGPGDVVQLDRHVADPVDLIVGDKIVARGEVVLVNGNFGLRVSEVAAPRKRLESIRCLF